MNFAEVMQALEQAGTAQTRKTYMRHGVQGELFGVLTSDLKTLQKKIKQDHALAVQLWESGNYDARTLATMIIDPAQITEEQIDRWLSALNNYADTDYLAGVVAQTKFIMPKMLEWTAADGEWIETAGWGLLNHLALNDMTLPDSFFDPYLQRVENEIHTAKNRVRYNMNNFLICVGARNETLRARVEALARQIGKVYVDHGQTDCKTPEIIPYLERMYARKEKKKA
ncbi:MAG: DNA alkylation repair protein [Chloroflexi bacterium]|nr:DNA alkylation repair protein [Chloroflexota bacterium]